MGTENDVETCGIAEDAAKKKRQVAEARAEQMAMAKTQAAVRAAFVQKANQLQEVAPVACGVWLVARTGISYGEHNRGLRIAGFVKESSAQDSQLMIGDIITQIGDDLISGLPSDVSRGYAAAGQDSTT